MMLTFHNLITKCQKLLGFVLDQRERERSSRFYSVLCWKPFHKRAYQTLLEPSSCLFHTGPINTKHRKHIERACYLKMSNTNIQIDKIGYLLSTCRSSMDAMFAGEPTCHGAAAGDCCCWFGIACCGFRGGLP